MLLPGSGENRESSLLLIDGSNWHHVAYTCWQGFRMSGTIPITLSGYKRLTNFLLKFIGS